MNRGATKFTESLLSGIRHINSLLLPSFIRKHFSRPRNSRSLFFRSHLESNTLSGNRIYKSKSDQSRIEFKKRRDLTLSCFCCFCCCFCWICNRIHGCIHGCIHSCIHSCMHTFSYCSQRRLFHFFRDICSGDIFVMHFSMFQSWYWYSPSPLPWWSTYIVSCYPYHVIISHLHSCFPHYIILPDSLVANSASLTIFLFRPHGDVRIHEMELSPPSPVYLFFH
jgi:hypothetical protein